MTAFLSAISGQFTKSWILGALFPAAIFVLLWLAFVAPLLPPGFAIPAPHLLGDQWGALSISFATLLVAALLYNLGIPLMQLYEGYPWRDSVLGRWRTRVMRRRMEAERTRAAVLFELTAPKQAAGRRRLLKEWNRTRRELPANWPDTPDLVLPTRLGNVLRAFERYPWAQYGIDAIPLWPRMVSVIPGDYAAAIDGERTSFVFLLNLSFLCALLAVATLASGLAYLPPGLLAHVFLPAAAFAFLSVWLYRRLLGRGKAWGEMVKGAFDLYRGDLLKKLGYRQEPRTRDAERALWKSITLQIIYNDKEETLTRRKPRVEYAEARPARISARAADGGAAVEVSRGVRRRWRDDELGMVAVVSNPQAQPAVAVVVSDTVPEGYDYEWGSARVNGAAVAAAGINPYEFSVGDIPPCATVELTYTAVRTGIDHGGEP